jgi:predicted Fe-Mo cluster-binding NifX family protein
MLIAIPVSDNKLDIHFGHCKNFSLLEVDVKEKKILSQKNIKAPPHQPGLLPSWLAQLGVNIVIAGGIGQRAKDLLDQHNIKTLIGSPEKTPEKLVDDYLKDNLNLGSNLCDH